MNEFDNLLNTAKKHTSEKWNNIGLKKIEFFVKIGTTLFSQEEIRQILPRLQHFVEWQQPPKISINLPKAILEEIWPYFHSAKDMENWLKTPNDVFSGKKPIEVSHTRLVKTLRGEYE